MLRRQVGIKVGVIRRGGLRRVKWGLCDLEVGETGRDWVGMGVKG